MKGLISLVVAATTAVPVAAYATPPVISQHFVGEPAVAWSNECDWMNPKPSHCFPMQPASISTSHPHPVPEVTAMPLPITSTGHHLGEPNSNALYRCTLIVPSATWQDAAVKRRNGITAAAHSSSACDGSDEVTHGTQGDNYESHYDAVAQYPLDNQTLVQQRMPDGNLTWDFAPGSSMSVDKIPAAIRSSVVHNSSELRAFDTQLGSVHGDYDRQTIKRVLDQQPLVQKRTPDGTLSWNFSPEH